MRRGWPGSLLLLPALAGAAELERLDVRYADGRVRVAVEARVQASPAALEGPLNDYRRLPALLPLIKRSELVPAPPSAPDVQRVRSQLESCVWIVCRRLGHVMDVRRIAHDSWHGETLPALSDFRAGWAAWSLQPLPCTGCAVPASRLHFAAELEPRAGVPPPIGPWLVERGLRRELHAAIARLEAALGLPPAPRP